MAETQAAVDYPIYLGVWTNWSLGGRIKGSTITLDHHNGALLTAFLAVFIAFAGSRLWRIVCFVIHWTFLSKMEILEMDSITNVKRFFVKPAMKRLGL